MSLGPVRWRNVKPVVASRLTKTTLFFNGVPPICNGAFVGVVRVGIELLVADLGSHGVLV